MGIERFFIEHAPQGEQVSLSEDESHHLRRVRRLQPGDEVVLFDGSGTDYVGRIESFGRGRARIRIERTEAPGRELGVAVTLAVALVKKRAMAQLVDQCTQLGVARLTPIVCEWSVVRPGGSKLGRWRRIAIEACKQCERSVVPEIAEPVPLDVVLAEVPRYDRAVMGATRSGSEPLGSMDLPLAGRVLCLIGPEGGFTDAEIEAAVDAGCTLASLGRSVLRTETAAAAAMAVIAQLAGPPRRAY
ncbi:MAG: 16S rRNA (uracil(1498)-N(3))-methyltransferase [Planctomycetota bacterium]